MASLTRREIRVLVMMYEFEEKGICTVGPSAVAGELKVSRPTAYELMLSLVKKGCLCHIRRKGFSLTERGRSLAKLYVRAHRIIETFAVRMLGLELSLAHSIAHDLSDAPGEFVEALHEKLGRPKCCPHGKPIPEV